MNRIEMVFFLRFCLRMMICVAGWLGMSSCNDLPAHGKSEPADTRAAGAGVIEPGKAGPAIADSLLRGERHLSAADKQWIDWQIPLDAELVFMHETAPETIAFSEEVLAYLKTRSPFSLKVQALKTRPSARPDSQRILIDFRGDHQYVITVLNQQRPPGK